MARHRNLRLSLVLLSAIVVLAGCNSGPSVSGTFDRNYTVTGPILLELTNASGDVDITGSADGKVHVQAASGTIRVEKIERDVQLTTASGSVSATDVGNDVRVSSASGSVNVSNTKGDVRVNAL